MRLPPSELRYPHRCTIWRGSVQRGADKTISGITWSAAATGVPCRFETGESVKAPSRFVLDESDNMFTFDVVRFAGDGAIPQTGDVLKQTTGPESGEFWVVRGEAKLRVQLANAAAVRTARTDDPPEGVS